MWTIPIGFLLTGDPGPQPEAPKLIEARRVDAVVVPVGSTVALNHKTGNQIVQEAVPAGDEKVIQVTAVSFRGNRATRFKALKVGVARLTLTDVFGKEDEVIVIVEEPKK